mgnify:CR=1 FL=1
MSRKPRLYRFEGHLALRRAVLFGIVLATLKTNINYGGVLSTHVQRSMTSGAGLDLLVGGGVRRVALAELPRPLLLVAIARREEAVVGARLLRDCCERTPSGARCDIDVLGPRLTERFPRAVPMPTALRVLPASRRRYGLVCSNRDDAGILPRREDVGADFDADGRRDRFRAAPLDETPPSLRPRPENRLLDDPDADADDADDDDEAARFRNADPDVDADEAAARPRPVNRFPDDPNADPDDDDDDAAARFRDVVGASEWEYSLVC